jgi:uncharacterized protein
MIEQGWILLASGILAGLLAGLLGIGGGALLVPILLSLGYSYASAVATSSLSIVLTSLSGSWQNWRMGYLKPDRVILLGLPGVVTALAGASLVAIVPKYVLEAGFGGFMLVNIYLSRLKQRLAAGEGLVIGAIEPTVARIVTGGVAGLLAGIFGIGGGAIMVPLQMLFLGEKIKLAIQTSLGVIILTSIAACIGHARAGNVLYVQGILLGIGGAIGVAFSARFLPKLSDRTVYRIFCGFLVCMALYFFYRAWQSYRGG